MIYSLKDYDERDDKAIELIDLFLRERTVINKRNLEDILMQYFQDSYIEIFDNKIKFIIKERSQYFFLSDIKEYVKNYGCYRFEKIISP